MESCAKDAPSAESASSRNSSRTPEKQLPGGHAYRPEIDGLRAIAVLAVVLYHIDTPGITGGFAGVDVFFVISGYLITSILCREIEKGDFQLSRFYERRARRILPALFATMLATLAVGMFVYDPVTMNSLGKGVTATSLFCSNVFFWMNTGYFGAPKSEVPLLHTWSLAVEEQFYLLWPFFLIALCRMSRKMVAASFLAIFSTSFATSTYGAFHHPAVTFYMTPTRAWELMLGAALAMRLFPLAPPNKTTWRVAIRCIGLALILGSIFTYTKSTPFPGLAALAPAAGTALILHSGGQGTDPIVRVLCCKLATYIGATSYSLYLWHWPIVSLMGYLSLPNLTWTLFTRTIALIAFFLVAHTSWRFIEEPFRASARKTNKISPLATSLTATILICITGLIAPVASRSLQSSKAREVQSQILTAKSGLVSIDTSSDMTSPSSAAEPLRIGHQQTAPAFALIGDSHARSLIPALELKANNAKISGLAIWRSSTPPVLGVDIERHDQREYDVDKHNRLALELVLSKFRVKLVILAARWPSYVHGAWTEKGEEEERYFALHDRVQRSSQIQEPSEHNAEILESGLKRAIELCLSHGAQVAVVACVPELGASAIRSHHLTTTLPWLYNLSDYLPGIQDYYTRNREMNAMLGRASRIPGVVVVRPDRNLIDANGQVILIHRGNLNYYDDDHLSYFGSLFVASAFDDAFFRLSVGGRPPAGK